MDSQTNLAIYEAVEKILGTQVAYKLHRRMCIRRLLRAGCIFIHIPKAAGTSIGAAVVGRRAGHYTAAELRTAMGPDQFDTMFSFSVTRHPLERLVSAYRYARGGGGTHGAIRYVPAYNSELFRSFDAFVNEWLVYQDLTGIDHVFHRQWPYLYAHGECLVNYVGHVDDMNRLETMLTYSLNRDIRIPHKNKSRESPDMVANCSKYTLELVHDLYRNDFDIFGYEMEF